MELSCCIWLSTVPVCVDIAESLLPEATNMESSAKRKDEKLEEKFLVHKTEKLFLSRAVMDLSEMRIIEDELDAEFPKNTKNRDKLGSKLRDFCHRVKPVVGLRSLKKISWESFSLFPGLSPEVL